MRLGATILSIALAFLLDPAEIRAQRTSQPADSVEAARMEFMLDPAGLESLVGQPVSLLFTDGEREEQVTLQEFVTIKFDDQPRLVVVTHEGETRKRRYPCAKIFQVETSDKTYQVNQIPSTKCAVLQDVAARREDVEQQLRSTGNKFWEPISSVDQQKYVDEEKEYLKKVREHFPTLPMQLHETKYFLFLTDMPPRQVAPYLTKLDKMNEILGQAFGLAPGDNVWRGKAVIVAFTTKAAFVEFESQFFGGAPSGLNAQGLCHSFGNGRVVTSCYRGDDPDFFGALLVHETSHGYVARYKSTARIPSWLNEGIAEWVARAAVPQCGEMRRRQTEGANTARQAGTLNGLLSANYLDRWQYGVSLSLIDLLMNESGAKFSLFFNGIKEGLPWEVSLTRAYGATPEELVTLYGRAIRVPQLTP